jgi:hypothetical protein
MTIWLPGKLMCVQTQLPEQLPVTRPNTVQLSPTQIPPMRVTVTGISTTVLEQISHPACRQSCAVYPFGKQRTKRSLDVKMFRLLPFFYGEKQVYVTAASSLSISRTQRGRQHGHRATTHLHKLREQTCFRKQLLGYSRNSQNFITSEVS